MRGYKQGFLHFLFPFLVFSGCALHVHFSISDSFTSQVTTNNISWFSSHLKIFFFFLVLIPSHDLSKERKSSGLIIMNEWMSPIHIFRVAHKTRLLQMCWAIKVQSLIGKKTPISYGEMRYRGSHGRWGIAQLVENVDLTRLHPSTRSRVQLQLSKALFGWRKGIGRKEVKRKEVEWKEIEWICIFYRYIWMKGKWEENKMEEKWFFFIYLCGKLKKKKEIILSNNNFTLILL